MSPRGQVFLVQMLRDGEIQPSDKVAAKLSDCLLCETCSSSCPSGIQVHEMIQAARTYVASQRPSFTRKLIFDTVWSSPVLLRRTVGLIRLSQRLGLQTIARTFGLTKLLPGDLSKAEGILSSIPRRGARQQLPALTIPARGTRKYRVAYFLGCATDLLHPEVALATVEVLTCNGCEVVIPSSLKCCGMPQVANGEGTVAQELARHNNCVLANASVDAVVSDCASCTSALKSPRYQEVECGGQAEIYKKVYDLNVFLVDCLKLDSVPGSIPKTVVTYHDPCHLVKAQKVKTQPRKLLRMIPGVELKEIPERCCGGSGTFALTHYDLSMKILNHKVEAIAKTNADLVATACPSCIMQLEYGLRQNGLGMKVLHPVQLLSQAYQSLDK